VRTQRGKMLAFAAGSVGLMVIFTTVVIYRSRLREEWYLWKLESQDPTESYLAAKKLGTMPSVHVVEPLLMAIHRDRLEHGGFTPQVYALYNLGEKALPMIELALEREKKMASSNDGCAWILSEVRDAIEGHYSREFKEFLNRFAGSIQRNP
jgi:hypothetical protein